MKLFTNPPLLLPLSQPPILWRETHHPPPDAAGKRDGQRLSAHFCQISWSPRRNRSIPSPAAELDERTSLLSELVVDFDRKEFARLRHLIDATIDSSRAKAYLILLACHLLYIGTHCFSSRLFFSAQRRMVSLESDSSLWGLAASLTGCGNRF